MQELRKHDLAEEEGHEMATVVVTLFSGQSLKLLERLMKIRLLLWLTGIVLLLSVIVGSSRRRSKNTVLKACLWASYIMSSYLVAYNLGLMQTYWFGKHESFFPIWALLLMLAFGGADSFSGYSIDDNEQWRRYNAQLLLKFGTLIFFLYTRITILPHVNKPMVAVLFLASVIKAFTKTQALAAIKRVPLQESLEVMDKVTLADVWTHEGELLTQGNNSLKDICMSFAFFKILCIRYSGYASSRETHRRTWPWIRDSLLSGERREERVFRVVEQELAFLYDILYTKYAVIFQPNRLYLRLVEFLLIAMVAVWMLAKMIAEMEGGIDWNPLATTIALVIFSVSEACQVIQLAFTRWAKVNGACRYVKLRRSSRACSLSEKCIEFICRLPSRKPWERKLHQYSLLESCTYRPSKLFSNPFMYQFVEWHRDGQKESAPVALTGEVMAAVVDGLEKSAGSQLENGVVSLRRNNMLGLLAYVCKFTTQAEVIMVWSIATAICENNPAQGSLDSEGLKSFSVATSLSKYLAYLVAFEPRLLPDHPAITESLFAETIEKARSQLRGCNTVPKRIEKLYQTVDTNGGDITLRRGTELAQKLLEQISERSHMWKVLVDFWVELTLFVAPSDDVRAHADKLANGGEFLTHIWALLYHAGIERRPFVEA